MDGWSPSWRGAGETGAKGARNELKASTRAKTRYNRKVYDEFYIRLRKDGDVTLDGIKQWLADHGNGMSQNEFIRRAIKHYMDTAPNENREK